MTKEGIFVGDSTRRDREDDDDDASREDVDDGDEHHEIVYEEYEEQVDYELHDYVADARTALARLRPDLPGTRRARSPRRPSRGGGVFERQRVENVGRGERCVGRALDSGRGSRPRVAVEREGDTRWSWRSEARRRRARGRRGKCPRRNARERRNFERSVVVGRRTRSASEGNDGMRKRRRNARERKSARGCKPRQTRAAEEEEKRREEMRAELRRRNAEEKARLEARLKREAEEKAAKLEAERAERERERLEREKKEAEEEARRQVVREREARRK